MKGNDAMTLEITKAELETLKGILIVEQNDLRELVENEDNPRDRKSLKAELDRVSSMLNKIKE